MRRAALLLVLSLAACGAVDDSTSLPLGIDIHGLSAEQIGKVQIVVLSHARNFPCPSTQAACVKSKVIKQDGTPIESLVKLKDEAGVEHNALLFEVKASELTGKGQTFQARMAPGSEYMVVAEVLSKDARPTLLASGCSSVLPKVSGGQNAAVGVQANALAEPATCDVVIE